MYPVTVSEADKDRGAAIIDVPELAGRAGVEVETGYAGKFLRLLWGPGQKRMFGLAGDGDWYIDEHDG